ncbi:MAG: exodeoxyribonuclease VII large subunit, partial [Faecalimonas sp.]|nr:exodeoxyribonuclease VII large subunit [Faecalimonas sp.]
LYQRLQLERTKLERYRMKLGYLHPATKLREQQQHSVELEQRLRGAMERSVTNAKQRLALAIARMKGLSPLAKLNQGFSYVAAEDGSAVRSIAQVRKDDSLAIYVTDGVVHTRVEGTAKEDYSGE